MDAMAEITRCICGHEELQTDDPDIDSGLFIQCDKCQVWQHGYCVGIGPDDNLPDDYACEKCRPDLHLVVQRPSGKTSKFMPIYEANAPRQRSSRHSSRSDSSLAAQSSSSSSSSRRSNHAAELARKSRSTMNSRDSAYEEVLRRVLEVSAHETQAAGSPGANGSDSESASVFKSGRPVRGKKRPAQTAFDEDGNDEDTKLFGNDAEDEEDSRHHRRRRVTSSAVPNESGQNENDETDGNDDDEEDDEMSGDAALRSLHRNGAKKGSTGWKQQLSAKHSRSTQSPTDTADEGPSGRKHRNRHAAGSKLSKFNGSTGSDHEDDEDGVESGAEARVKKRDSPEPSSPAVPGEGTPEPRAVSKKATPDEDEEKAAKPAVAKEPASPVRASPVRSSQPRNRRSRKQQTTFENKDDDTDASATGWAQSAASIADKPSKPRIPQNKSTLSEMRKRVAAILEFIRRTQIDMASEQDERKKLFLLRRRPDSSSSVVSSAASVSVSVSSSARGQRAIASAVDEEEVDGLFGTQKMSLELLDGLTRKLLLWEQQFGRHGEKS